ncbi:MAG: hypothetical protein VR65_11685 [Desulfobulbaceae bacterium BRH_c16a]|nr:MAG: hypothetical protein VR65_11685 [Desulfobulbaceae bacterium BRH_c16a]
MLSSVLAAVFTSAFASAADYSFSWSANPEPVEGYKLYYKKGGDAGPPFDGTDSASGPSPVKFGKQTSFVVTGLADDATYHFSLTAYNGSDESAFTETVTVTPGTATASSLFRQRTFSFNWNSAAGTGISAYRFFINDRFLCQSTAPAATSLSCKADLLSETMFFSMTTVDSLGNESVKSNILTYVPPLPTISYRFGWDPTLETGITAHRFFINDQFFCQSANPAETSLICKADLLSEMMYFSMTALDSLGYESVKSNIIPFDPAEMAVSPAGSSATLRWAYDPADTTVSGYKIYQNDILIGQIADPNVSEYTSYGPLDSTNVFEVTAYDSSGLETKVASTVTYPAGTTTGTLTAVIITNSQKGETPLAVNFDGGASSGPVSSYTWSFGDGDAANGAVASHTYQFAGTYTATLKVADTAGSSQSTSITISGTASTSDPTPGSAPVAVISSSSAVGTAPFTVIFDGLGSTSSSPPLTYSWDFGDSSIAEGSSVAHTYTLAGTYSSSLTVRDSTGRTDQVSTPVIISSAPVQTTNQLPKSSFTATPGSGASPLTVTFDGSGSSDADGSIKSYQWSFGDGTTAAGISAQHTFTDIANYTVTLQVTDDKDGSAASSQVVSARAADAVEFYFELWEIQVDHNWTRFNFHQPFTDPVVVTGPPSFNESDPTTVRVRNIDPTGCEIRLQEWEYPDGVHAPETLTFLVMEKGAHIIDNGSKIEAGTFIGATSFKKIDLQNNYISPPVILFQVITDNEVDAVAGRLRNTTTSSFEHTMQERENTPTAHGAETIGYIAMEPGSGAMSGLPYEADFTAQTVTDSWSDLAFRTAFPDQPLLVAGMQTHIESDPAVLRSRNTAENTYQIKIEEERSADEETKHAAEVVGYLAIGNEAQPPESGAPISWMKKITFTWEIENSSAVIGYRFHVNDSILCESTNPADRQSACETALLNQTMNFTMTSVLLDGSESEPAAVLSISPEDYPDLFGIRLVTYIWEYDTALESGISGFGLYINDNLFCETMNPEDRQLTCKTQLDSSANAFTVRVRGVDGAESGASNSLEFVP